MTLYRSSSDSTDPVQFWEAEAHSAERLRLPTAPGRRAVASGGRFAAISGAAERGGERNVERSPVRARQEPCSCFQFFGSSSGAQLM